MQPPRLALSIDTNASKKLFKLNSSFARHFFFRPSHRCRQRAASRATSSHAPISSQTSRARCKHNSQSTHRCVAFARCNVHRDHAARTRTDCRNAARFEHAWSQCVCHREQSRMVIDECDGDSFVSRFDERCASNARVRNLLLHNRLRRFTVCAFSNIRNAPFGHEDKSFGDGSFTRRALSRDLRSRWRESLLHRPPHQQRLVDANRLDSLRHEIETRDRAPLAVSSRSGRRSSSCIGCTCEESSESAKAPSKIFFLLLQTVCQIIA